MGLGNWLLEYPAVRISESHSVYRMAHRNALPGNSLPYLGGWDALRIAE